MCSSHQHERVDTRALQQIKSQSVVRLISLALLLAVSVTACSSGKTKPRAFGIGIRQGSVVDKNQIEGTDGEVYAESSLDSADALNDETYPRFPVFIQFDENLFENWAFGEAVVDYSPMSAKDIPPSLREGYTYGGKDIIINDSDLDNSKTNIAIFRSTYPEYASKIDAATNPTISADYDLKLLTFGYQIGVFLPLSERHRILTFGAGFGLNYIDGIFFVNLCDPYRILDKQGFCKNKQELLNASFSSGIDTSVTSKVIGYSYIGEDLEFNIFTIDNIHVYKSSKNFTVKFWAQFVNEISVIYRF